jgi:hypothetical protein
MMADLRSRLEARRRAFAPESGAFDRLVRRRRRKMLRQRISVGVVALTIAGLGLFAITEAWFEASPERPAHRLGPTNVHRLEPAWTVRLAGDPSTPVVRGGIVYVVADRLYAFPADCGSGGVMCRPLWTGEIGTARRNPPVVTGSVVVVSAGGLVAFPTHCGTGGDSCDPLWTADPPPPGKPPESFLTGFSALAAAGETVYAAGGDGLYAFDVACRADGGACAPTWVGEGAGQETAPEIGEAFIYVRSHETLYAFPVTCPRDRCEPSWIAPLPARYPTESLEHHGEALYAENRVFAADCGREQPPCKPLWVAGTDPPTARDLAASALGPATIHENVVYWGSSRLYAFPERCGTEGGTCDPVWKGPHQTGVTSIYLGWSQPTVVNGLVFSSTDRVSVFEVGCATGGAVCAPLWVGPPTGTVLSPVVGTDRAVYVASSDGTLRAYEVASDRS